MIFFKVLNKRLLLSAGAVLLFSVMLMVWGCDADEGMLADDREDGEIIKFDEELGSEESAGEEDNHTDGAGSEDNHGEVRNGESAGESNGESAGTVSVKLFFVDNDAIATDNQGEYGYVVPVNRDIPVGDNTEEQLALTAVEELLKGPLPADGDVSPSLPDTISVLGVSVDNGTATVNLSSEALTDTPGGALGGAIFLQTLVYTVTQFAGINDLLVQVDGQHWDDGHQVWFEPLAPEHLR